MMEGCFAIQILGYLFFCVSYITRAGGRRGGRRRGGNDTRDEVGSKSNERGNSTKQRNTFWECGEGHKPLEGFCFCNATQRTDRVVVFFFILARILSRLLFPKSSKITTRGHKSFENGSEDTQATNFRHRTASQINCKVESGDRGAQYTCLRRRVCVVTMVFVRFWLDFGHSEIASFACRNLP